MHSRTQPNAFTAKKDAGHRGHARRRRDEEGQHDVKQERQGREHHRRHARERRGGIVDEITAFIDDANDGATVTTLSEPVEATSVSEEEVTPAWSGRPRG